MEENYLRDLENQLVEVCHSYLKDPFNITLYSHDKKLPSDIRRISAITYIKLFIKVYSEEYEKFNYENHRYTIKYGLDEFMISLILIPSKINIRIETNNIRAPVFIIKPISFIKMERSIKEKLPIFYQAFKHYLETGEKRNDIMVFINREIWTHIPNNIILKTCARLLSNLCEKHNYPINKRMIENILVVSKRKSGSTIIFLKDI